MAEYTLTLQAKKDYTLIKYQKLLKAIESAEIRLVGRRKSELEKSLEEARVGKLLGPFYYTRDLIDDLLR